MSTACRRQTKCVLGMSFALSLTSSLKRNLVFSLISETLIQDQLFGTEDKKLQKKLLRETEVSLESAVKMREVSELARQHVPTFDDHTAS